MWTVSFGQVRIEQGRLKRDPASLWVRLGAERELRAGVQRTIPC